MARNYSEDLYTEIRDFLDDDNWHYEFDSERGFFRYNLSLKGKLKEIHYIIDVREDAFVVYGISNVGGDPSEPQVMAQLVEFFARANYGLRNGCFEIDMNDGEIRYRTFVDCEEALPSQAIIRNSIYIVARTFERYAPGILAVLFANTTAERACEDCEKE